MLEVTQCSKNPVTNACWINCENLTYPMSTNHQPLLPCHLPVYKLMFCPYIIYASIPAASDKTLPEAEFSEDVYHCFHWCVVCDSEGTQIKNATELQWMRAVCRKFWRVLSEVHNGIADHPILALPCILCVTRS